jgi:hypothetical protein
MPSTYTTNGGIELPANGEQSGTWGETVNDNMAIIDRLTNGVGAISLSGTTHTLTTADGTLSDGQYNVLVLGGSPSGTNTITISPNDGEHVYVVKNASGQTATFTQGSGANVSVLNNTTKIIYADGAGAGAAVVDITGALDLGSLIIAGTSVTATAAELNILDGVTATAAELNYNDITTLGTVQASKTVTANASGDVLFPDGDKAIFGTGSDLQIYHNAFNSIIQDSGTGNLYLGGDNLLLTNAALSETYLEAITNGEVNIRYDDATKLATTATGIDVTGTVAAAAGTALLPSITTTGDLNTGMWFPAADTIAFSEGGVEALRIDSSGNVGIGTSSPSGELDVTASKASAVTNLYVRNPDNSGGAAIRVQSQTDAHQVTLGITDAGSGGRVGTLTNDDFYFVTNNTERMRIDSNGALLLKNTVSTGLASGDIALANASSIRSRNAANSAYLNIMYLNASNELILGGGGAVAGIEFGISGIGAVGKFDSSGNLLVGTTDSTKGALIVGKAAPSSAYGQICAFSPTAADTDISGMSIVKYANNSTTAQVLMRFLINQGAAGQGQINANGANTAAFGSYSDSRLKENIVDLPSQLDSIMALRPVEYDYIESMGGGHQIGFVAQEVQAIYPDLVGEDAEGMLTLTDMNKNDARLIKAIQEQQAIIEALEARITALEG